MSLSKNVNPWLMPVSLRRRNDETTPPVANPRSRSISGNSRSGASTANPSTVTTPVSNGHQPVSSARATEASAGYARVARSTTMPSAASTPIAGVAIRPVAVASADGRHGARRWNDDDRPVHRCKTHERTAEPLTAARTSSRARPGSDRGVAKDRAKLFHSFETRATTSRAPLPATRDRRRSLGPSAPSRAALSPFFIARARACRVGLPSRIQPNAPSRTTDGLVGVVTVNFDLGQEVEELGGRARSFGGAAAFLRALVVASFDVRRRDSRLAPSRCPASALRCASFTAIARRVVLLAAIRCRDLQVDHGERRCLLHDRLVARRCVVPSALVGTSASAAVRSVCRSFPALPAVPPKCADRPS